MKAARVAFLVNADVASDLADRARQFEARLRHRYTVHIAYRSPRKIQSLVRFVKFLWRVRPAVIYVVDMAYSGVVAALVYRALRGAAVVVETGDAIRELVRSTGARGPVGQALTGVLERVSLRTADAIVVRGHGHQRVLAEQGVRAHVIQDGVDLERFRPAPEPDLRRRLGLDGVMTIGFVGSSVWAERLQMCYGWELVETIRLLRDVPVKGVVIGDGSGIPHLRARCRDYGIEDRVLFLGRIPFEQLSSYLNLIDVCLSTQTNDVVGQVRTTGKLPLYLATGRYILASRVGEAARVLDEDMLVEYEGVKDTTYPAKLAERIVRLVDRPDLQARGAANRMTASRNFDYSVLAPRVGAVIDAALRGS